MRRRSACPRLPGTRRRTTRACSSASASIPGRSAHARPLAPAPTPSRPASRHADAGAAGKSAADRHRRLRPVHGRGRPHGHRHGHAQDPDGDALTYQWTAAAGTLTSPTARQTPWTAPNQPGPVQFTVTVNDGKGGTANATTTIKVIRPTAQEITFEDVHFDFDRFTLRPDALKVLDEAVTAMQANPNAAPDDRRPHLQHRHGRVQPGARRAPRARRARLPHEPRHRGVAAHDGELRRGAAEARQLARRDAPAQPPRGAGRETAVGQGPGPKAQGPSKTKGPNAGIQRSAPFVLYRSAFPGLGH